MCLSVRLHDNSGTAYSIVLKFFLQDYLMNISIEFKDEKNPAHFSRFQEEIPWFHTQNPIQLLFDEKARELEFFHSYKETSTNIYYSIEHFLAYKMILNSRGRCVGFKSFSISYFPNTMKKPHILALYLGDMWLFSMQSASFFKHHLTKFRASKWR